ncbi:hypothetical protein J4Q44_G00336510 [Coregonus suidteri]|uniref:Carbonic anhydrase n=1 Tax=Coregonus suidteri TaxID=861788 RepID=A0AAN8QGQ9_9TELE
MLLRVLLKMVTIHGHWNWCYQSQVTCGGNCIGPDGWATVAGACGRRAQSPINIVTRRTLPDRRLTPFTFTGYQEAFHSFITNKGRTVQVDLPATAKVQGGDLAMPYKAVQLHLHLGKDGGLGSEHTIDGERYPMEQSGSSNKKYDSIINALNTINKPSSNTTLSGVSLDMFIPSQCNMTSYFRYQGSLTTPPCAEAVVWTIFENTIPLSRQQLAAFSQLQFADGKPMVGTYRPNQPLNGRQVYRSGNQVVLVSTLLLITSIQGSDWCYQSQDRMIGPRVLRHVVEEPSPINIVMRRTLPDGHLTTLHYFYIQVDLPATVKVRGGDLTVPYQEIQLHLHSGKDGAPGSEHTIDGERYPKELHIVNIKEEYNSLADALKDPAGVGVLGFFYEAPTLH